MIAPEIIKVELALNKSVMNSLNQESRLLEKSEKETGIRRARVQWLTGLSKEWTFLERAKGREGFLELPTWRRRRAGRKRSYSKVKKPGKNQRKKIKLSNQGKQCIDLSASEKQHSIPSASEKQCRDLSAVTDPVEPGPTPLGAGILLGGGSRELDKS